MPTTVTHDGEHWSNSDQDIVEIRSPDPSWAANFTAESTAIESALGNGISFTVHHVGSTAVPGMAAKPIIDIILEVPNRDAWPLLIAPLRELGYVHWDENPDKDRMFFVKGMPPFGTGRTHHIHVHTPEGARLALRFRDYLIAHPDEVRRYADLKRKLAVTFRRDRDGYTRAKDQFVAEVLRKAMATSG